MLDATRAVKKIKGDENGYSPGICIQPGRENEHNP